MISLYVNNKYLSTKGHLTLDNPTITLNIEAKSLKEPSILKCPYTYQFKVPMTSINVKLLGIPHSVQTVNHVRIEAILKVDSPELVYNGYLIVNECKDDFYSVSFYGSLGSVIRLLKNDGVKDTTLADIAPKSITNNFIFLEPNDVLKGDKITFKTQDGIDLFGVVIGRYGWGDQNKKLLSSYYDASQGKVTEYTVDLTDLLNRGSGDTQIRTWWLIDSITGEFLPFQFGDFRVEYLQPVLNFGTIFSWINSFFEANDFTFDYTEALDIVSNYGVALPLFPSVFKSDEKASYTISASPDNSHETFICSGTSRVDFYFGHPYYYTYYPEYDRSNQIGFTFKGSDGTKYITCFLLNDKIKERYPGYTYIEPQKLGFPADRPYSYLLISLSVAKNVRYDVTQFIQAYEITTNVEQEFEEITIERGSTGKVAKIDYLDGGSLINFNVIDNVGYYENGKINAGSTKPVLLGGSGSSIPIKEYLSKCESPYFYLTEFCKLFQFHLIERNNQVTVERDYSSNPLSVIDTWFDNAEITSVSPQVYTEGKLLFKIDNNKDWFTEQYNDIYGDSKLGSGTLTIDKYAKDNSDTKTYVDSKFKYSPFSDSSVLLLSPSNESKYLNCSNILYSSSGEQVDIAGTILHTRVRSFNNSYGISYDDSEEPGVLSNQYYETKNRYRVPIKEGSYTVYDTVNESGNDMVALGESKYYPSRRLPEVNVSNTPADSVNNLSRYVANNPYFYQDTVIGDSISLGINTYYAKKITIKASLTGYPSIFKAVRVGDWIINPTKVSVSIGKKDLPCIIEGLVYTTDVIK